MGMGYHGKSRRQRRVRPLLLALLWVWALCVFIVLDLFLNVSSFDHIRPRADLYRGMRVAAHDMVGEPYQEEEVARHPWRNPRPRAMRRAPEAPLGGGAPDLRSLLGSRRPEGIGPILARLEDSPDPKLADLLLSVESRIAPEDLSAYARAAAATVASLHVREVTESGTGAADPLAGLGGELARAAVEAQAHWIESRPTGPGADDWRGARITLERIGWVAPGYERLAPFEEGLQAIRHSLEGFLAGAARSDSATNDEVEALRLSALIGNTATARVCLRFLAGRLGDGGTPTREAFLAREYAVRTVVLRGQAHHRLELERRLAAVLAQTEDPGERDALFRDMGLLARGRQPGRSTWSLSVEAPMESPSMRGR